MTIARKYIRQCRTLFPVYGKSERTFLNRLKVQVNEHLDLFPDLSYEKLVEQFGVWGEKKLYGRAYMGTFRTTFLINEEGIVERIITPKEVKTKEHASQILNQ